MFVLQRIYLVLDTNSSTEVHDSRVYSRVTSVIHRRTSTKGNIDYYGKVWCTYTGYLGLKNSFNLLMQLIQSFLYVMLQKPGISTELV